MPSSESKRTVIRVLSGVGAVAVLYVGLAWWTSRDVPSSMAVEGVQIGGLSVDQAAAKLIAELGPKATAPITVTVPDSDKSFTVDPTTA
ncbi:MAG TPA: vanomycin resistance protein VanB, partial [Dermatophilaceae bacterium]|nr:vanomycin resistance protein VanB [Dermatophilaceae bacterium]